MLKTIKTITDYFLIKHHKKKLESLFSKFTLTCRMTDIIDYHEYLETVKLKYPAIAEEYDQKYCDWRKERKEFLL